MAGPYDCYTDSNGCTVCPEIPASPAVPPRVISDARTGWNAGANTIDELTGDVHAVWSFDTAPAGVFIGLKSSRKQPTEPSLIPHALYVYASGGHAFVEIREAGKKKGTAVMYTLGDALEIRRVGATITYYVNDVLLGSSPSNLGSVVVANACLYTAGDSVP